MRRVICFFGIICGLTALNCTFGYWFLSARQMTQATQNSVPVFQEIAVSDLAETPSFAPPITNGIITSPFGQRARNKHTGIDIGADMHTPVLAAADGIVSASGWLEGYGNTVVLDHGNGFQSLYAHCASLLVEKNNRISQGTVIAKIGSTGNSTGPHLHFEIRKNGVCVDPTLYCPFHFDTL